MTLPKFVLFLVLSKLLFYFYIEFTFYFSGVLFISGVFSVLLGTLFALRQWKVRRLLAYSSIANLGYLCLLLATFSDLSFFYAIFYILIYLVINFSFFAWFFVLQKRGQDGNLDFLENLTDFTGLAKVSPLTAFFLAFVLFSYAGIPPFLGFFSKFFLLTVLVDSKCFFSAFVVLGSSAIALIYYLFFIKVMFFSAAPHLEIFLQKGAPLFLAIFLTFLNLFGFFFIDMFFSLSWLI